MKHFVLTLTYLVLAVGFLFVFEATRFFVPAIAAAAFALASIRESSLYLQTYKGGKR